MPARYLVPDSVRSRLLLGIGLFFLAAGVFFAGVQCLHLERYVALDRDGSAAVMSYFSFCMAALFLFLPRHYQWRSLGEMRAMVLSFACAGIGVFFLVSESLGVTGAIPLPPQQRLACGITFVLLSLACFVLCRLFRSS